MSPSVLDPMFSTSAPGVVSPTDLFDDEDREQLIGHELDGVRSPPDEGPPPTAAAGGVDPTAPIPGGGPLLAEPRAPRVFKAIDREVQAQDRLDKNRHEEAKHWGRIKRGQQFSILAKSEDASVFRAILPDGIDDTQQPIPNKVMDLCQKQVSQILVDPPLPNPKSDGDSERNQGAMDLAKRFLRADGDVAGTNDMELWRECLSMNRTTKSAFVFVWVDPTAGGWRPKQKQAHPRAPDPAHPLLGPVLDAATGQPQLDPTTGQPVMESAEDPVLRYVGESPDPATGALREVFVAHASEAAREWLPRHRRKLLGPDQVRTLPMSATVAEAHSVVLLMWEPLAEAKKRFPILKTRSASQVKQLVAWKPKRWKTLVPEALRPKDGGLDTGGNVTDDTLLFWYHKFCRISEDYPDGGEIAVSGASAGGEASGNGFLLTRDTLREDVELDDGTTVPVLMEMPVAQFRALLDTDGGDPFGFTPVAAFGGANEIRAHLYMSTLEDVDVRLHPNTYLTSTSTLTGADLNRRDGSPLEVLTKDDMPTFEQRPAAPTNLPAMLERIEHDMDVLANLNQTAQGLDSSYAGSGEAKKVAISQAKVQLAQEWQGFTNGVMQYWKIKLQLAQARLKTPQLVRLGGENQSFHAKHFIGADLVGVSAVTLMPGSGTMMSPAEKAQYLTSFQQQQWLTPADAGEMARASMSDDLGLPPSPPEECIERCIADWIDGPPAGWEEQFAHNQHVPQLQQAYQQDLATVTQQLVQLFTARGTDPQQAETLAAQQAQTQLGKPPEATPLSTPFTARPNDAEPPVALIHATKLSRLISTVEYRRQSAAWRTVVDQAYTTAAQAAGLMTLAQQTQAKQAEATFQAGLDAQSRKAVAAADATPSWKAFLQSIEKLAVSKAASLTASEIAAIAAANAVAEKGKAMSVPIETGDGAPDPTHLADLAHTSAENAADRAHAVAMAGVQHSSKLEQIAAKTVGDTLSLAARNAARAQGAPTPQAGTPDPGSAPGSS